MQWSNWITLHSYLLKYYHLCSIGTSNLLSSYSEMYGWYCSQELTRCAMEGYINNNDAIERQTHLSPLCTATHQTSFSTLLPCHSSTLLTSVCSLLPSDQLFQHPLKKPEDNIGIWTVYSIFLLVFVPILAFACLCCLVYVNLSYTHPRVSCPTFPLFIVAIAISMWTPSKLVQV